MDVKKAEEINRQLSEKVAAILAKTDWRAYFRDALTRTLEKRRKTISEMFTDFDAFRHEVREIRERSIAHLDELLNRFIANCEKRGVKVHVVKNAVEACAVIHRIALEKNAKLLTKSKSMTTEEIELNAYLEQRGLRVVETDLGELIIQMAGEKPFHLVYPAVHKTRREVAEIFSKVAGRPLSDDINELMLFAREYLREIFVSANVAITGVNIAIAETGTIVVETNEGNDRLGNTPAPTYIAVMGLEKLVETLDDALKLIMAHPVSATGQTLTTYVSFITGRNPLGVFTDRELHVVVIDNGRSAMRNDPVYKEALYCIRCGACMNICPTYSAVGGHVFGYIYTGPIGITWTHFVHGLDKAAEFAPLCISCGLCKEICPAIIDIPFMIAETKHRYVKKGGQLLVNKVVQSYESAYRFGSRVPWLFNALIQSRTMRKLMEKSLGIDSRRTLPKVASKPLDKLLNRRKVGADAKAILFVDFFARYVRPDLGVKAVRALEEAGMPVLFPSQRSSGYPYLAYGDVDKARQIAKYNVEQLAKHLSRDRIVVSVEPTATYALKHVYVRLLPDSAEARKISESTYSLTEVLAKLVDDGKLVNRPLVDGKAAIHIPCHERALDSCQSLHNLLSRAGVTAVFVETGTCCGMAGTFGMKHGVMGYELANAVGEPLFDLVKRSGCRYVVTNSSVCRIHIEEGAQTPVYHPLEVLDFSAPRRR
ncbi:MAG: LUD domain-containing protein [Candidatus Caldarchaeum sp.]